MAGVKRSTSEAISAARALGRNVVATYVCDPEDRSAADRLTREWQYRDPGVPLVLLDADPHQRLARPVVEYLRRYDHAAPVVLIAEVEPAHPWLRILQNQRGAVLARAVRRGTNALVCRLRFPVLPQDRRHHRPSLRPERSQRSRGDARGAPTLRAPHCRGDLRKR
ncbi:hypothetical protein [Actinopolymorpha rutila]|uniref:Uncharacterized protein n=1 Tax=Actinopolymorpha rutila TaxID=446787 RepID=A0A852ZG41_9ACTN|nr:hypothetical protein [Actinopolymorpha rutila]NYH91135.1 hypothetical protein [Actinopolymorpha rutila]